MSLRRAAVHPINLLVLFSRHKYCLICYNGATKEELVLNGEECGIVGRKRVGTYPKLLRPEPSLP